MNFDKVEGLSEQEIKELYIGIIEENHEQILSTDYYCVWDCQCKTSGGRLYNVTAYGYNNGDYSTQYATAGDYNRWAIGGCERNNAQYLSGGCNTGDTANSAYTSYCSVK